MTEMLGMYDRSGLDFGLVMDRCLAGKRFGGSRMGFNRVRQVGEAGMRVNHGGSAFPVGARLDGDDDGTCLPDAVPPHRLASVVDIARGDIHSARRPSATG